MRTVSERFWSHISKGDGPDACWLWTSALTNGYGRISIEGRSVGAHRWSYEQLVGPIPDGLQLDHLCRVRNCVNPAHLEPVTGRENCRRGVIAEFNKARAAERTACPQGHEFTEENTYLPAAGGGRKCRICQRRWSRDRQRRIRGTVVAGERRLNGENE